MPEDDPILDLSNFEYEALSVLSLRPETPDAVAVRLMIHSKTGHKIRAAEMVNILDGMVRKGLLRAKGKGKRRLYQIELLGAVAHDRTLRWLRNAAAMGVLGENPNGPALENFADWPSGYRADPD